MDVSQKWFVILNPVSGHGRGLDDWPHINKLLRDAGIIPDYAFTERQYHAVELAVWAVTEGYKKIIVIGGDGTLHEVVNGLFIQKLVSPSEITIAVIATGAANDWARMFGSSINYKAAVESIARGETKLYDVGEVSFHKSNYRQSRYMVNVAGIGMNAYVARKYSRKRAEGRRGNATYKWTILKSIFRYRSTGVKIWIDGEQVVNDFVYSAAVGIGKYSGRGMQHVPDAIPDDGLFDVTVIKRISKIRVLRQLRKLYDGSIYDFEKASHYRGKNIRIESAPETGIEVDGEPLGYTPFEFKIIPETLKVVVYSGTRPKKRSKR